MENTIRNTNKIPGFVLNEKSQTDIGIDLGRTQEKKYNRKRRMEHKGPTNPPWSKMYGRVWMAEIQIKQLRPKGEGRQRCEHRGPCDPDSEKKTNEKC